MKIQKRFQEYYSSTEATLERGIVPAGTPLDKNFFDKTEAHRYSYYPYFHDLMQFANYRDKCILEVGVGLGVDHKQFADYGAHLFGIDLTMRHILTTQKRLQTYHLSSHLGLADAEYLPFTSQIFDLVYACGVLFLVPDLEKVISEIYRVLRPGGEVVGLFYNRSSFVRWFSVIYHGFVRGELRFLNYNTLGHWYAGDGLGYPPFKYVDRLELRKLFGRFEVTSIDTTELSASHLPGVGKYFLSNWVTKVYEPYFGFFLTIRARKPE